MNYPLISEYIESIKYAEDNFATLTNLRPVLDDDGNPIMSSGNFAVVFKMKDEQTRKMYAVKCFLREQEGRDEAYRMISEELEYVNSTYLTPIKYLKRELFVNTSSSTETEFPVLLMDWVEGETLDKWIRNHIGSQYLLQLLAYRFCRMSSWLLSQPFAHGDIKPDNILVQNNGALKLVDYDGMFVPALKGNKASELGSPDYRHPSRTIDDFNEHIDDFSLATISMQLYAIALDPHLLNVSNSDTLLLTEIDYMHISRSEMIHTLMNYIGNNDFSKLLSIFFMAYSCNSLENMMPMVLRISRPLKSNNNLLYRYGKQDVILRINGSLEFKFILVRGTNEIDDFYLAEIPVTQELWQLVMGNNPSFFIGAKRPVDSISWFDANEFTKKLSNMMNAEFRLPTSAEWEFAAKGGIHSKNYKYSGSNELSEVGWCASNSGNVTHDVKQKLPNEIGLYDMSGNVYEWCSDSYYHKGEERKIARGGTIIKDYADSNCEVSHFSYPPASDADNDNGMRLVLNCPFDPNYMENKIKCESFFIDERDGNRYRTIRIGNKVWLAENLRFVINLGKGSYLYGKNTQDIDYVKSNDLYKKYGLLYNYETAKIACPKGWHLPSDDEWKELELFLGMDKEVCKLVSYKQMPENYKSFNNPRTGINILTLLDLESWNGLESPFIEDIGFNARPGGWRTYHRVFEDIGIMSSWWTSTENKNKQQNNIFVYQREIRTGVEGIIRADCATSCCLSVRCIKDF